MQSEITPFLQRYEEDRELQKNGHLLEPESELTFFGPVYMSLLLNTGSGVRYRQTTTTKVLNETSDE